MIKNGEVKEVGDKRFVLMAGKFVNIDELSIDLIDSVNPFQRAFEILSKTVTKQVLKGHPGRDRRDADRHLRGRGTLLWPKINLFVTQEGRPPSIRAPRILLSGGWPKPCCSFRRDGESSGAER